MQGCLKLKSKQRLEWLKRRMSSGAHFEKMKGTWEEAVAYCQKTDTAVGGGRGFARGVAEKIRDSYSEPNDFQIKAKAIIEGYLEARRRDQLIWFHDPIGGIGKTAFVRQWVIDNKDETLMVTGKGADIKYAVANWVKKNPLKVVFLNITRAYEGFVSYDGIESVQDGILFSSKYESEMVVFNPPLVVVMANFEPDKEKMSAHRWKVHHFR